MAFLGRTTLLLITLFSATGALASHPQETQRKAMLRAGAWEALKRCDRSRALFWAQELEKLDPDQALLYRLAWLEAPRSVTDSTPPDPEEASWAWTRSAEIWADEKGLEGERCKGSETERTPSFSSLPSALIEAELKPALARYASARPALREALRGFALFEWLQGRKLSFPRDMDFESTLSKAELCEWRALRALHAEKEDAATLGSLATQCLSPNFLLWAVVKTRAGDLLLKTGQAQAAFASFHSALSFMPDRRMPKSLAYRIAMSGILGGAANEVIYRAAHQALSSSNTKEKLEASALPTPLQSGLANLLCEKIKGTRAQTSMNALKKVFKAGALVSATLQLTEGCETSHLGILWLSLLDETKDPKDRSRILVRSLASAIARNDPLGKGRALRELSILSKKYPSLARHAFWSALQHSRGEKNFATIRELVNRYRKNAHWSAADEIRLKHLLRPENPSSARDSEGSLQVSKGESKTSIRLPMALLAEPVSIQAEVPACFTALLRQDLNP